VRRSLPVCCAIYNSPHVVCVLFHVGGGGGVKVAVVVVGVVRGEVAGAWYGVRVGA